MDFHKPVLLKEVLGILNPNKGDIFIDGTLGNGGHTIEILKTGATVYGLDADKSNLEIAISRIKSASLDLNFHPINANFSQTKEIIAQINQPIAGILLDLGLSSNQQKSTDRGFSFNDSLSLDMRVDTTNNSLTAEEIINTYDFNQLAHIFSYYSQEKLAKPIAIEIIHRRQIKPIKNALTLANIIQDIYQKHHLRTTLSPATKTMMALRIVVNSEYDNLTNFLQDSLKFNSGVTVAIITFHSGEDRIVKQFIKTNNLINLTPKPISPRFAEISSNPLSRSSKLRSYRII